MIQRKNGNHSVPPQPLFWFACLWPERTIEFAFSAIITFGQIGKVTFTLTLLAMCFHSTSEASDLCQLALHSAEIPSENVPSNQIQKKFIAAMNLDAAHVAPIIEEFVNLVTNTVEKADSPLRATILKALLQTKQLELTQKFGPTTAKQLLAEMQHRVQAQMSRDFQGDDGNQNPKSKSTSTEQTVKVLHPSIEKVFQHSGAVKSAVFSLDASQILTASDDKTAKLWDIKTGQLLHSFEGHTDWVRTAVFSHNGSQILTASDDWTAKIWDIKTGQLLHSFESHSDRVRTAVFSLDDSQILTASQDKTAVLLDIKTGEVLKNFVGHKDWIRSAVFSPDGNTGLTASDDITAQLWDLKTGKRLHTFTGHQDFVNSAVFSPDGSQILTASDDKTAKLWDLKTGDVLHTFTSHQGYVNSAVFSPDGSQILTASDDKTAKLWELKTGKLLHTFKDHTHWVKTAVFSPDGSQILTASEDNTAILWDVYKTVSFQGDASIENNQPGGSDAK